MNQEERNRIVADATGLLGYDKKPDAMAALSNRLDAVTAIVQEKVKVFLGNDPIYNREKLSNLIGDIYLAHMNKFNREELEILLSALLSANAIRSIS